MRSQTAFTLIELVIVILILSIFFGIGYGSLTRARTNADFKQAVNETVGILQNARNKAMTNPELMTAGGEVSTATAFYVTIDPVTNTLSLYADFGGDTGELLESVVLDGDLILTIEPSDITRISYEPPMGELTFVLSGEGAIDGAIINLSMANGAFTEKITLNQFRGMPEIVE
ncbi:MAG: type II secretion system protein [Candidatus Gracilibacteria bacterium]